MRFPWEVLRSSRVDGRTDHFVVSEPGIAIWAAGVTKVDGYQGVQPVRPEGKLGKIEPEYQELSPL